MNSARTDRNIHVDFCFKVGSGIVRLGVQNQIVVKEVCNRSVTYQLALVST
jgi:hypothetical protein